ncbi:hypothetical protein Tco_0321543 [Tanacetum coccineum]
MSAQEVRSSVYTGGGAVSAQEELDNQGYEKVTPRRLFNEGSGEAGLKNSQKSLSIEDVGGYSSNGSSRAEVQSRSKTKNFKSKPQSVRASQRKSSLDSGYDTMSDSSSEDLIDEISEIVSLSSHQRQLLILLKSSDLFTRKRVLTKLLSLKIKVGLETRVIRGGKEEAWGLAVALGRLTYQVKDIRQSGKKNKGSAKGKAKVISMLRSQRYRKRPYERVEHWMDNAIVFPLVPCYQLVDCLVIVDDMIEGFIARRIYVDGGSSSKIIYEHYFRNLSYRMRSRLRESRIPLVGFSGKVSYPLRVIDLEVTIREYGRTKIMIMEFAVVKIPSPNNTILGRTGMRSLGSVASTIYSMIKFPTSSGLTTITTSDLSDECRRTLIQTLMDSSRHDWNSLGDNGTSPGYYPYIEPKVQKKRSLAPDMRKVVTDEVNEWLTRGIMKRVRYPLWVSNLMLVNKVDGSWRMCIDFKDLNKARPKDLSSARNGLED